AGLCASVLDDLGATGHNDLSALKLAERGEGPVLQHAPIQAHGRGRQVAKSGLLLEFLEPEVDDVCKSRVSVDIALHCLCLTLRQGLFQSGDCLGLGLRPAADPW